MLLGKWIFLYCGPPVFRAAKSFPEKDVMQDSEILVPVETGWFDGYVDGKKGNMDYCKYCWANSNFQLEKLPHSVIGGDWKGNQ